MTGPAVVTVLADHGSLTTSLPFFAPVVVMLVALGLLTLRERRRSGSRS